MRAVVGPDPSDPQSSRPLLATLPDPVPGPGEVLLSIAAAGLNHAELHQVQGHYPPAPGESAVPGLECSGRVAALGEGVGGWKVGDLAMALLGGGGHATRVAVPVGQMMQIPDSLSLVAAGALPEAALTAWTNLVVEGGLEAGETVLVTGATGGMGSFTVQLARELGARVIAAGRSRERLERLRDLGITDFAVEGEGFGTKVSELTGGRGVDLVLDLTSGQGLNSHLDALAPRGRLVLLGLLNDRAAPVDLSLILRKRLQIVGSTLRYRPRAEKAELVAAFAAFALPRLADRRLRPVVDRTVPLEHAAEAYAALAAGGAVGKIVLTME
jgi:putative PIG3 family NAD(P)H quinone oxidoreductase